MCRGKTLTMLKCALWVPRAHNTLFQHRDLAFTSQAQYSLNISTRTHPLKSKHLLLRTTSKWKRKDMEYPKRKRDLIHKPQPHLLGTYVSDRVLNNLLVFSQPETFLSGHQYSHVLPYENRNSEKKLDFSNRGESRV